MDYIKEKFTDKVIESGGCKLRNSMEAFLENKGGRVCKTGEARSYFEICTNLCVFLSVFLLLLAQSNWVVCCAPRYLRGDNATWESSSRVQFLLDFFPKSLNA